MFTFNKRHIAKTLSWRFIGTIDTILLSWCISGDPWIGLKIGGIEVFTKMFLYYLHERFWFKTNVATAQKRHIYKTFTWRILGTLDTVVLSWVISGNPWTGLKIGFAELFTKMLLYYLHERLWYQIDFGIEKRKRLKRWKKT